MRDLLLGLAIVLAGVLVAWWMTSMRVEQYPDAPDTDPAPSNVVALQIPVAVPGESPSGYEYIKPVFGWMEDKVNPQFVINVTLKTIAGDTNGEIGISWSRDAAVGEFWQNLAGWFADGQDEQGNGIGAAGGLSVSASNPGDRTISISYYTRWTLRGNRVGKIDDKVSFKPEEVLEAGKKWEFGTEGSLLVHVKRLR